MAPRFAELLFTPNVVAEQHRYASPAAMAMMAGRDAQPDSLGPAERDFIQARDGFYMATVNETGWPYVQFRGGPPGFLRVLDEHTLGFADFRGNRQLISTGNLAGSNRAALILMDYAQQTRLKILATVRIADAREEPQLVERLRVEGYRGRVERAFLLTVEGLDWNCPQHITPRFTEAEIQAAAKPLIDELEAARRRIAELEQSLRARAS